MAAKRAAKKSTKKGDSTTADIVAVLQSKYPGKVFTSQQYTSPWMLRRYPSGVVGLDIALSGGFPAGGLSVITAEPGVGKNYLANCVIAYAQKTWGDDLAVGCVGTEMPYDKSQARFSGVRIAYSPQEIEGLRAGYEEFGLELSKEEAAELQTQVGTFVIVPPDVAERQFNVALDMVRSRKFHIVLIDSFGSLLLGEDKEKDMDDNDRMAGPAMLNSRFATRLNEALSLDDDGNPNLTCVLGINQVRDNMKRMNPNSPTKKESGGWALKHARWVTVNLTRVGWLSDPKNTKRRLGKDIRWEITKQKAGGHDGHVGFFHYMMESGCNFGLALVKAALEYGIVIKSGNTYTIDDEDETLLSTSGARGKGIKNAGAYVNQDPELGAWLYKEVLREAGVRCQTR